jgi:hypothetical protein
MVGVSGKARLRVFDVTASARSLPSAQSVKELLALIKTNPGKYSFASPGVGTPPQLVGELFRLSLAPDLVHLPFNGGGPAIGATVAGHTPLSFGAVTPAVPLVNDGRTSRLSQHLTQHHGVAELKLPGRGQERGGVAAYGGPKLVQALALSVELGEIASTEFVEAFSIMAVPAARSFDGASPPAEGRTRA